MGALGQLAHPQAHLVAFQQGQEDELAGLVPQGGEQGPQGLKFLGQRGARLDAVRAGVHSRSPLCYVLNDLIIA